MHTAVRRSVFPDSQPFFNPTKTAAIGVVDFIKKKQRLWPTRNTLGCLSVSAADRAPSLCWTWIFSRSGSGPNNHSARMLFICSLKLNRHFGWERLANHRNG